jgi:hypothetical protein
MLSRTATGAVRLGEPSDQVALHLAADPQREQHRVRVAGNRLHVPRTAGRGPVWRDHGVEPARVVRPQPVQRRDQPGHQRAVDRVPDRDHLDWFHAQRR